MNAPATVQELLTFAGRHINPDVKRTVVVVGDRGRLQAHAHALADHFNLAAIQHDYGSHRRVCPNTLRLTEHVPTGPFHHPVHIVSIDDALRAIVDQLQEAQ